MGVLGFRGMFEVGVGFGVCVENFVVVFGFSLLGENVGFFEGEDGERGGLEFTK